MTEGFIKPVGMKKQLQINRDEDPPNAWWLTNARTET
jgi:hypothetical protein